MNQRISPLTMLYFSLWTGYFTWFWWHVLAYDETGGLVAGQMNLWADWALHFSLGYAMAERDLLLTESPLLIGHPFGYPFAADLLSALLLRAGADLISAFVVPSLVFSVLLVGGLFYFLKVLFRSDAVAALGASLFLLSGGLGFLEFLKDVVNAPQPWHALLNPAHEYTHLPHLGIKVISVIDSIIVPQRSFTHGVPLALIALGLIHSTLVRVAPGALGRADWIRLAIAALLLGILPIVHAHSLLAAFVILACWSLGEVLLNRRGTLWQRLLPWVFIVNVTALAALPLMHLFLGHTLSGSFFRWYPGWYARELGMNWFVFWLRNWGILPLLALAGLGLWAARPESGLERGRAILLGLPFFLLFALVNLFLFAPWIWDNTKLLAWSTIGLSGLAAYGCVRLWQGAGAWLRVKGAWPWRHLAGHGVRAAVLGAGLVSCASGGIDAYWDLRADLHKSIMYTREDLEIARWVRQHTDPRSIWLAGNQHNHWLVNLTGRQPLMAYRGWLWSHGMVFGHIESDVNVMFATADPILLGRYGVDYVVIGPDELANWSVNERAFSERYPLVHSSAVYRIYRVGGA